MIAEIVNVGTELLLGNIVNTNARYLASGLQALGISCFHQTVVGDNGDRLVDALKTALSRSDVVITTGGLGPTYDDITKTGVVRALGLKTELDPKSLEHVKKYYAAAGKEFTDNNLQQAEMPVGATVFENNWGTANALAVEKDGKTVILLPGPPREMEPIFEKYVIPFLEKKTDYRIVKRKVRIFGVWEAHVENLLYDLLKNSVNPSVAPYCGSGEVLLQVTARAKTEEEARAMTEPAIAAIRDKLGEHVYGVDVENLEQVVLDRLREKKQTVAFAESCTGGLLAKRITDLPGSSEVFGWGIVAYSNEVKQKLLDVKEETLKRHGAVSAETAAEMAAGVRKLSGVDYGVSVTGIAGPGGGTAEKPVGTVFVGIASAEGVRTYDITSGREGADRAYLRTLSASQALNLLRKTIGI